MFLTPIKVNKSRYEQYGVTPHLSKILRKDNIDPNIWENIFDRSAEHK